MAVDVFIMDMGRFADLNAIYAEYFSDHKPARAAIQGCRAAPGRAGRVQMRGRHRLIAQNA